MTLPLFELDEWFATAEGRFDLSLGHSGCESAAVTEFVNPTECESLFREPMGYGEFEGLTDLREVVAEQYATIDTNEVLTFNGPSEAIYTFMRATLSAGDRVIVPSPLFHSLHAIARHVGCDVVEWAPVGGPTGKFDVEELAKLCEQSVKLIVINFPHNPTGQMITESQLQRIVEIAQASDALIFSDECFRLLELPPMKILPAACDLYEKAVSVTGLSKPFGLGGLRMGWMVTKNAGIRRDVKRYRFYTAEMTNTPCQFIAAQVLRNPDAVLSRNRALISANLEQLQSLVAAHTDLLRITLPQAGTMCVVEQHTDMTSTEFCERVLKEQRLFVVPSGPLGMPDRFLRIGLGQKTCPDALKRLGSFLHKL